MFAPGIRGLAGGGAAGAGGHRAAGMRSLATVGLRNRLSGLTATLLTLAFLAAARGHGPRARPACWLSWPPGSQLGLDTSCSTSYRHHGGVSSGTRSGGLRVHGENEHGGGRCRQLPTTVTLARSPAPGIRRTTSNGADPGPGDMLDSGET